MLSEKYIEKHQIHYKIYEFIYKFRIYFIILLAIIVAVSASLMGIKGIVINNIAIKNITYGSKLEYSGKAIFGNVDYYEFRESSSDKWTREEPKLIGNYFLRGVSKSLFGNLRHGKEEAFTINPLTIEFESTSTFEYGSTPVFNASLQYSDFISNCDYEIISASSESLKYNCKINQDTFKIINSDGIDVTYCYNVNFKDTYEFSFTPKPIAISSKYSGTYDGTKQKSSDIKITKGELFKNDYIKIDSQESYVYAGSHINRPQVKVYTRKNVDVTSLYGVSYSDDSRVTINKRPITITTLDFSRVYDSTNKIFDTKYLVNEGSLVSGDILYVFTPYEEDVGTYSNKGEYLILSKDNVDVTSSYDVTIIPGEYTITPKKATVEVFCASKEYNGEWNDNLSYKTNDLFENHIVSLKSDKNYAYAKTYQNHDVNVSIINSNSNKDVTKNYELTIKYSNGFTVTKRPITIKSKSYVFKYDGTYKSNLKYEVTSGSLLNNEEIKIVNYSKYKDVGKYENKLEYQIINSVLGDVTNCYNITSENGTLYIVTEDDDYDINKDDDYYDIKISSEGNSTTYDGTYQKFDHLQITSYIKNIKIKKFFNEGFKYVGKYKNTFDAIVYDSNGNILDENKYVIKKLYGEIEIKQKEIKTNSFKFNGHTKQFGKSEVGCFIEDSNLLAKGDMITKFKILSSNPGCEVGKTYVYIATIDKIFNKNYEDVTNCYENKIFSLTVTYVD